MTMLGVIWCLSLDLRQKGSFKVNKREMCLHINSDIPIGALFVHDFVTS